DTNTSGNMKLMVDKMSVISGDMSSLRVGVQNSIDVIKFQLGETTAALKEYGDKMNIFRSDFDTQNEQVNEQFMDVSATTQEITNIIQELNNKVNNDITAIKVRLEKHDYQFNELKSYNTLLEESFNKKIHDVADNLQELSSS